MPSSILGSIRFTLSPSFVRYTPSFFFLFFYICDNQTQTLFNEIRKFDRLIFQRAETQKHLWKGVQNIQIIFFLYFQLRTIVNFFLLHSPVRPTPVPGVGRDH